MNNEISIWLTIAGMTVGTYLTRIAGLWAMRRIEPPQVVHACLHHAPGSILTALIVPTVLSDGPSSVIASLAVIGVSMWRGGFVTPMGAGVVTTYLLRLSS